MQKIITIILLVIGVTGLAYGGFSYTSDVHKADTGSLHLSLAEKERVNIPVWAGVAFILAGGVLGNTRKNLRIESAVPLAAGKCRSINRLSGEGHYCPGFDRLPAGIISSWQENIKLDG